MTTIGVVGYGVVGKAVSKGFCDKGFTVLPNDVTPGFSGKRVLLEHCDVIFICVNTPPLSDGHINNGYLIHALNEFADLEANPFYKFNKLPLFIIKSTVTPGTTANLEKHYPEFKFAVNPEFLRSTYAEKDFLNPDRIVMGTNDDSIKDTLWRLYDSWSCPKIMTSSTAAELIKHLSNAFLTAKVAFACEMQRLCQHHFIDDMDVVFNGVTSDHRIHGSHLDPLLGPIPFDSPCLPKDLLALIKSLESDGVDTSFLQSIFDKGVQL